MNKKKLIISGLLIAVATIFLLIIAASLLNIKTYHSFDQEDYSFKFKGSLTTVRKVIIYKDSKKAASLPFKAESDIFKASDDGYSAILKDANGDGETDLILPCEYDDDGDVHYTIYLSSDTSFVYDELLSDMSNVTLDGEFILTEETVKETEIEENANSPEIYVTKHSITRYGFTNGAVVALEERAIIYYSENDYYCYSVYAHDDEYGGLKYVDEKWFDPEDLGKYPLGWD